jgi:hypothetical protein
MASADVIKQVTQDVKAYYDLIRNMSIDAYIAQRDALLPTYFTGPQLANLKAEEKKSATYKLEKAGSYTFKVLAFSPDGMSADVQIASKGIRHDVYDLSNKQLKARNVASKDSRTIIRVRFDVNQNRWKVEQVLQSNVLSK